MILANSRAAEPVRLITLDPGHFHAALFYRDMLDEVSDRVHVYAPLGPELLDYLTRISQFNSRERLPTRWKLEVHAGGDFWERLLRERPGNVVVLSGNNRSKINRVLELARAGFHVLADKPWIIEAEDFPKLQAALDEASQNGVVIFDAMTQRFEITCRLQRELVRDPGIFGTCLPGSEREPAVRMDSLHYLMKEVDGVPNLRPARFFDVQQQGEGLSDVGTHLVDLVQWIGWPDKTLDYDHDIKILNGQRWPTVLTLSQFQRVTGESAFPAYLSNAVHQGQLDYMANNSVDYTLSDIHVRLNIKWAFESLAGSKDTEYSLFRGSKSRIEVRQGKEEDFRPEVYVLPNWPHESGEIGRALEQRVALLAQSCPGLKSQPFGGGWRLVIPPALRLSHEQHFSLLARKFLQYVKTPDSLPGWEKPNMLAKYRVTTQGVNTGRAARKAAE